MNQRQFNKMLKKQIEKNTPDVLDRVLAENRQYLSKKKTENRFLRNMGLAAAGLACLGLVLAGVYQSGYLDSLGNAVASQPSEASSDAPSSALTSHENAGGRTQAYPPKSFEIACELPQTDTLRYYTLKPNPKIGNIKEIIPRLMGFQIVRSDAADVQFETDHPDIIFFGNADTGLFFYQHIRNNEAEIAKNYPDDADNRKKTYQSAMSLAESLKDIVGEVILSEQTTQEYEVEASENNPAYTHRSYIYIFSPKNAKTVDGFADSSALIITFDADGTVFSMENHITLSDKAFNKTLRMFDIEKYFTNQAAYDLPDAEVVLTKWDIKYSANARFDGVSVLEPYVEYEYTVNGRVGGSGSMTLDIDLD